MKALLLVLVCVALAHACDPVQISFDLCNADLNCRTSMYIDENGADLPTFEFLYYRLLGNASALFADLLCNETSNNTAMPSNFEVLWTLTMSKYRYCNHINQYFDGLVAECVCKADKLCKYTSANNEEFHFTDNSLFFIALLLAMLVLLMFFVKRTETLYTLLLDYIRLLQERTGDYIISFTK